MSRPIQSSHSRIVFPVLLGILSLLHFDAARAVTRQDTSLRARLDAISRQMANEHNTNFILVEALKDSLIYEGGSYDFSYTDGMISENNGPKMQQTIIKLNGTKLPEPLHGHYVGLIKNMLSRDTVTKYTSYLSMQGDGIKLSEVLDPRSKFRRGTTARRGREVVTRDDNQNNAWAAILGEMMQDGLLDTSRDLHVQSTIKGVFVNGRHLDADMDLKYQQRFAELFGFKPSLSGNGKEAGTASYRRSCSSTPYQLK